MHKFQHKILVFALLFFCSAFVFSQSGKQKELEARRLELSREIQQINALLTSNQSKEKSQISQIEDLNHKVRVRENLIKVTNQQANLLTREINSNQKQITTNRNELTLLKESYSKMLQKAYKNKNKQSRVMFLLSATNFKQAYKRVQYLNQYADYQKDQADKIKVKTIALQEANTNLLVQKEAKSKLVAENKKEQIILEIERKQQETIMKSIKKDLDKYTAQIKNKQKEARLIDNQIDKLIREAIAASNKKANTKTTTKKSKSFALTAEAKALAADFLGSKGKLPWPVEKGVVKLRYGKQPSPVDRNLTINSNGVRISTEKGAKVRAVFNGEVMSILKPRRSNPIVMIKHGNYITTYQNLGKIYVKTGDKVTTKQDIGEVFTNPTTGETILKFRIDKDDKTQNPSSWIYKM
ncbi:murein hydrolase activator EnvC family protein [Lacinutrix jangbogonensis]|uniref:murein hydrolase activator EnvC family protein n=1 Tax=Lacinutrix jangbogonensis TaxID=1469557 RepID=UPI00053E4AA2|nr:peptidoglycan DD-metalloendopeptidase family protein [Lacinutrix jangbogonensis]